MRCDSRFDAEQEHGIEMAAIAKCMRCVLISQSWHKKPLEKCMKETKKRDFKDRWDESGKNLDLRGTGKTPKFESGSSSVLTGRRTSFQMTASYWFITIKEFIERYRHPPKDIGLHIIKYRDEFARHYLEGCFIKPSVGDPQFLYRVATMMSEHFWVVNESVMSEDDRLHENQPMDMFHAISDEHQNGKYKETRTVPPYRCFLRLPLGPFLYKSAELRATALHLPLEVVRTYLF